MTSLPSTQVEEVNPAALLAGLAVEAEAAALLVAVQPLVEQIASQWLSSRTQNACNVEVELVITDKRSRLQLDRRYSGLTRRYDSGLRGRSPLSQLLEAGRRSRSERRRRRDMMPSYLKGRLVAAVVKVLASRSISEKTFFGICLSPITKREASPPKSKV